mgnify:FL=1
MDDLTTWFYAYANAIVEELPPTPQSSDDEFIWGA